MFFFVPPPSAIQISLNVFNTFNWREDLCTSLQNYYNVNFSFFFFGCSLETTHTTLICFRLAQSFTGKHFHQLGAVSRVGSPSKPQLKVHQFTHKWSRVDLWQQFIWIQPLPAGCLDIRTWLQAQSFRNTNTFWTQWKIQFSTSTCLRLHYRKEIRAKLEFLSSWSFTFLLFPLFFSCRGKGREVSLLFGFSRPPLMSFFKLHLPTVSVCRIFIFTLVKSPFLQKNIYATNLFFSSWKLVKKCVLYFFRIVLFFMWKSSGFMERDIFSF